jgi:hypothetical protein
MLATHAAEHQVREEAAILKQGEVKLLTNGDAGPGNAAIASHNEGDCGALSGLTVNPPAKLFLSYNRGIAAANCAVAGMHRKLCQRRGEVEDARHLRA